MICRRHWLEIQWRGAWRRREEDGGYTYSKWENRLITTKLTPNSSNLYRNYWHIYFTGSYKQEQNYPFSFVFSVYRFLISTVVRNVNIINSFCFISITYAMLIIKKKTAHKISTCMSINLFKRCFFIKLLSILMSYFLILTVFNIFQWAVNSDILFCFNIYFLN